MFLRSQNMSTLEKLAERFQIPLMGNFEASVHEGWVANNQSFSVEFREKDKHGILTMYVYISIKLFINHQLEDWDQILIDSLSYLEEAV
jgi:hypothetical protein